MQSSTEKADKSSNGALRRHRGLSGGGSRRGAASTAALLAAIAAAAVASAQDAGTLLAISQARTATGAGASLELIGYDPATLEPFARVRLPGRYAEHGAVVAPGIPLAAVVSTDGDMRRTDSDGPPESHVTFVRLDRFLRVDLTERLSAPGWSFVQVLIGPGANPGEARVGLLTEFSDEKWAAATFFRLHLDPEGARVSDKATFQVPGSPQGFEVDWENDRAYVVGLSFWGDLILSALDWAKGEHALDIPAVKLGVQEPIGPAVIRLLPRREAIAVLATHRDAAGLGRVVSSIHLLDSRTLAPLEGNAELAGGTWAGTPALELGDGALWAATYAGPGAFAYATGLHYADGALEKFSEHATAHASAAPLIRFAPGRDAIAIAAGNALHILDATGLERSRASFDSRVEAAAWSGDAVFVGEGPRIHRVNAGSATLEATSPPARGFVSVLGYFAGQPDITSDLQTDDYPLTIHFESGMPGRHQRIVPVHVGEGQRVVVDIDDDARRWLRLRDSEFEQDGLAISLGLRDQSPLLRGPAQLAGSVTLTLFDATGDTIPGGESRIGVTASLAGPRPPIVQWQEPVLGQTLSAEGREALQRILAGPPLQYSHRLRSGPLLAPPAASVVVIGLDAAAEGAMTRQVLLDYVARGGGLLFIGRYEPGQPLEGLRRWLEPLDVLIDAGRRVDGRYPVPESRGIATGLNQLAVSAGCYFEVSNPAIVSVPGESPTHAALAMREYGYGRVALLAAPTPLEESALRLGGGRRFARAIFGWLAGVQSDVRDSDFDGLPDRLEDANDNGRDDPGETSFVNPDSDGDGLPDGLEDDNFNGRVDEGETDPRRADTDGDGISDGADESPLPSAERPIVISVDPREGPAEGGTAVEIHGRNLPANTEVWFGDTRSPHTTRIDSTRLIAITPEQPNAESSQPLDVRLVPGSAEGNLVGGFSFRNRSRARLALESIARTRRAYDGYRGEMTLVLDVPDVRIDHVGFSLWIDPAIARLELDIERSEDLTGLGRSIAIRRYGLYESRVIVGPGEPLSGRVELGTLSWRLPTVPAPAERLHAFFRRVSVRPQWGGDLTDASEEAWIDLNDAAPTDEPRRNDNPPEPG